MKTRPIILFLTLVIIASSIVFAGCKKPEVIEVPEEKGPKWGFIDHAGKFVIKPQFRRVKRFTEGLAGADLNARWGFINDKGVFVIARNYEDVKPFSAGYAGVQMAGHWYVINKQGGVVWPGGPVATKIGFPHEIDPDAEDHAVAVPYFDEKAKKWGFHDFGPMGKGDIPPKWDDVKYFNDGLCPVFDSRAGKWGFINNTGTLVIDYKFDDASAFKNRVAECKMGDDFVWVDKIGTIAKKSLLDSIHLFSDELALQQKRGKFIFIKRSGEPAFRKRFRYADNFSEGLAVVQPMKSNNRGFIDTTGELVIPDVFEDAREFSEQKAAVRVDPDRFFKEYNEDLTPKNPQKKAEETPARTEKGAGEQKEGGTEGGAEKGTEKGTEGKSSETEGKTEGAVGGKSESGKTEGSTGGKTDTSRGGKTGGSTSGKTDTSGGAKTGGSTGGKTDTSSSGKIGGSTGGKTDTSSGGKTDSSSSGKSGGSTSSTGSKPSKPDTASKGNE